MALLDLTGKRFEVLKTHATWPKALTPGSQGIFITPANWMPYRLRKNNRFFQRWETVVYKQGKKGKFRIEFRDLCMPLFEKTLPQEFDGFKKKQKKELLQEFWDEMESYVTVSGCNLQDCSNETFCAWALGKLGHIQQTQARHLMARHGWADLIAGLLEVRELYGRVIGKGNTSPLIEKLLKHENRKKFTLGIHGLYSKASVHLAIEQYTLHRKITDFVTKEYGTSMREVIALPAEKLKGVPADFATDSPEERTNKLSIISEALREAVVSKKDFSQWDKRIKSYPGIYTRFGMLLWMLNKLTELSNGEEARLRRYLTNP